MKENNNLMKINSKVNVLCESYKIKEQFDEDTGKVSAVFLEGVAITFQKPTRNRVAYAYEPSNGTHKTLIGKPFLDTHNDTSIRTHPPFGHVEMCETGTNPKNGLPCLNYKVNIDPEEKVFIRKAKRGDIPGVSIQVLVDEVDEKQDMLGDFIEAHIREYLELSAVLIPGDGDSSMKIAERFHKLKENKNNHDSSIDEKDLRKPLIDYTDDKMLINEKFNAEEDLEEINIDKPIRMLGGCRKKTEVAFRGCKCPNCSKQMLKDTFTEGFHLRCWACNYIIKQKR